MTCSNYLEQLCFKPKPWSELKDFLQKLITKKKGKVAKNMCYTCMVLLMLHCAIK